MPALRRFLVRIPADHNLMATGELDTYLYTNPVLSDREQLELQFSSPLDARLPGLPQAGLAAQIQARAGQKERAALRGSNANRYDVLFGLEENSESNWYFYEEATMSWSPNRQVDLQLGAFGRQELYLQREALTSSGALSGEPLRVLSTGLSARVDWTPDDRLYLVASAEGGGRGTGVQLLKPRSELRHMPCQ